VTALTHAPSQILAKYLVDQAVFTDPAEMAEWPLFENLLPDDPSTVGVLAAAIYDSVGVKQGRHMDGGNVFFPGLQIRMRSQRPPEAHTKAQLVEATLEAVKQTSVVVESSTYLLANVSQTGPLLFIGYEEFGRARRPLHTLNFLITVSQTS